MGYTIYIQLEVTDAGWLPHPLHECMGEADGVGFVESDMGE